MNVVFLDKNGGLLFEDELHVQVGDAVRFNDNLYVVKSTTFVPESNRQEVTLVDMPDSMIN